MTSTVLRVLALAAALSAAAGTAALAGPPASAPATADMPGMAGMQGMKDGSAACPVPDPDSGAEMIGKPAPAWTFTRWVGPSMTQEQLRGKVVLLRWWNVGCHYCEATLPEIESLRQRFGKDGFVAIGVFHPKPPGPVTNSEVKHWAEARGFHGPLAIDQEWETLSRYWLAGHPERNWTSVSFLIDQQGRIVWVHGGGEYHHSSDPRHAACDARATQLEEKIGELLGEPRADGPIGERLNP